MPTLIHSIDNPPDFTERTLQTCVKHQGSVVQMRADTAKQPNGNTVKRDVVNHPGATVILPFLDNQTILLEWQYRYPLKEHLWEIPAGKLDANETELDCAKRELLEETGYCAKQWDYVLTMATSAGFSNEKIYLYKASQLYFVGHPGEDDELIHLCAVPIQKAWEMIDDGIIRDAKTLIALLWWRSHHK